MNSDQIPMRKIVWMMWLQGEEHAPRLVRQCIKSWRKYNPSWEIIVLDKKNLSSFVELPTGIAERVDEISPASFSDIVRINLMAQHGGVWADATCLCRKSLDAWIWPMVRKGFFAFAKPAPDREISSWFLASVSDGEMASRFRDGVNQLWLGTPNLTAGKVDEVQEFLRDMKSVSPPWLQKDFWLNRTYVPYFWFHYLFAFLISNDNSMRDGWNEMPKVSADIPHGIALQGHMSQVNNHFLSMWEGGIAPFYKLTWRQDFEVSGTNINYAIDEAHW